jgi:DNA polymerase-3 subunit epsilon
VTKKKCDLVVAADKSSMSGKAKKARDYGISVISVQEFLALVKN